MLQYKPFNIQYCCSLTLTPTSISCKIIGNVSEYYKNIVKSITYIYNYIFLFMRNKKKRRGKCKRIHDVHVLCTPPINIYGQTTSYKSKNYYTSGTEWSMDPFIRLEAILKKINIKICTFKCEWHYIKNIQSLHWIMTKNVTFTMQPLNTYITWVITMQTRGILK